MHILYLEESHINGYVHVDLAEIGKDVEGEPEVYDEDGGLEYSVTSSEHKEDYNVLEAHQGKGMHKDKDTKDPAYIYDFLDTLIADDEIGSDREGDPEYYDGEVVDDSSDYQTYEAYMASTRNLPPKDTDNDSKAHSKSEPMAYSLQNEKTTTSILYGNVLDEEIGLANEHEPQYYDDHDSDLYSTKDNLHKKRVHSEL